MWHGTWNISNESMKNETRKHDTRKKKAWSMETKRQQGNPILFSISMKEKIMKIEGDAGAKKILTVEKNKVLNFETNNAGVTKDYNTLDSFNN